MFVVMLLFVISGVKVVLMVVLLVVLLGLCLISGLSCLVNVMLLCCCFWKVLVRLVLEV